MQLWALFKNILQYILLHKHASSRSFPNFFGVISNYIYYIWQVIKKIPQTIYKKYICPHPTDIPGRQKLATQLTVIVTPTLHVSTRIYVFKWYLHILKVNAKMIQVTINFKCNFYKFLQKYKFLQYSVLNIEITNKL